MSLSDRDELAELARALWAHLDWQQDLGVSGVERSALRAKPAARGASASNAEATGAPSVTRPNAPTPSPSRTTTEATPSRRPQDLVPEPDPAASGAPRFEMPAFLRKKQPAPSVPPPAPIASSPPASASAPPPAARPIPAEPPTARPFEPERTPMPKAPATPIDRPAARSLLGADTDARTSRPTPTITEAQRAQGPDRLEKLAVIQNEVSRCVACRLNEGRTQTVFSRGNPFAPLAFVGEGPGRDEDLQGEPFVGAAGQLLDKIIAAMGLGIDDVYICNVVKCRPPNNRVPAPDEMAACGPFLVRQLGLVKPKYIVALGKTATSYLLQSTDSMTKLRGAWHEWEGIPLLATWHPAYLLRNPPAKKDTWDDMKKVLQKMGRDVPRGGATR